MSDESLPPVFYADMPKQVTSDTQLQALIQGLESAMQQCDVQLARNRVKLVAHYGAERYAEMERESEKEIEALKQQGLEAVIRQIDIQLARNAETIKRMEEVFYRLGAPKANTERPADDGLSTNNPPSLKT